MRIRLADPEATEALGARLAGPLVAASGAAPVVLHLEGPLGAGKTTLARGLLRGLGHAGRVRSPTFTLLEPYELARCQVIHLDLYRLADPGELEYLGLIDMLTSGTIVLVEWAERGGDRLPPADLHIALDYEGEARSAALEGLTSVGAALIDAAGSSHEPPGARAGPGRSG